MTVKRQRYLPYAYAERALGLKVHAIRVGDELLDLELIVDPEMRSLDLRDYMGAAEPIAIDIQVTGIDEALLETVLPANERDEPPLCFVAVVLDRGGWYRVTSTLDRVGDVATGVVEFVPVESTGLASLEVIALRTQASAPNAPPGFATGVGMRVASSPELTLYTRERVQPPGGSLDVRWEDFTVSSHPRRKRYPKRIYYLETTSEPPVLWLNRAVPDLATVLESKGTRGPRSFARDLINQAIAGPVWYALLHVAALSVSRDEDGAATVPEGWRRGFLARIAPRVYSGISRERAYRQLLDELFELKEPGSTNAAWLIEQLTQAIHDELDLPTMVRRSLRELAR